MSNSIDNTFEISNPIDNLSFIWVAHFNNKDVINQFDNDTDENFKKVQERFNDLETFILYNKEKTFIVDLINGLIYFGDNQSIIYDFNQEKNNIRLIYFRRNRIYLNDKNNQLKEIWYCLGLQWNDNLGNNHKLILQIDKDGNFVVGV